MKVYIALLRGINVGGKNKIKMADLKALLESLDLVKVETYIQSGNVIFESEQEEESLRRMLESEIERRFGFFSAVVLRTAGELESILDGCPFSEEEVKKAQTENTEGESLYVCLMSKAPETEKTERLKTYEKAGEVVHIKDRNLYLLLWHSIRNSKLANNLSILDPSATVRNWKTLSKLNELAGERSKPENLHSLKQE